MRLTLLILLTVFFVNIHAQDIDIQHYKFKIELSEQSDAINGEATVKVKFLKPSNQLQLDLAGLEDEKGMIAFDVKENGKKLTATQANDKITIALGVAAKKGDTRIFVIRYMGTPKDGLIISKNKFGDRTFFADNWPDRAHNWIPVNDRPDDKAGFEFVVVAPEKMKVISNGVLIETKSLASNKKQTTWREDIPSPTKIMVIGAAGFAVKEIGNVMIADPGKKLKDDVKFTPVTAWIYPQDSAKGVKDFANAAEIVKFFSEYIAPYPYTKLANVQSTTMFGGMENASAIFYDENRIQGKGIIDDLIAHEIVHQWFGDMASEKNFSHLWLSEGFATYLTDYYFEKKFSLDSANRRLQREREQVVRFVELSNQPVVDSVSSLMDLLNANSYQKGAWFLHMLRHETGDSVFRKILQAYYFNYKGKNADTRDFQSIVETVTNLNWKSFFDQWLYKPGVPVLRVQWKTDMNRLIVTIKQTGKNIYEFPITVGYLLPDGTMMHRKLRVSKDEEVYNLPVTAKPTNLVLDPFTKLLFKGTVSKE
jgi:aminopeptidase N